MSTAKERHKDPEWVVQARRLLSPPSGEPLAGSLSHLMRKALEDYDANHTEEKLAAAEDLVSHRHAWRVGLYIARSHAVTIPPDIDDKGYWNHEIAAFERTMEALTGVKAEPVTEEEIAVDASPSLSR